MRAGPIDPGQYGVRVAFAAALDVAKGIDSGAGAIEVAQEVDAGGAGLVEFREEAAEVAGVAE